MKCALLQILLITCSPLAIAEEAKQSDPEKITPDKPNQETSIPDLLTLKDPRFSIPGFSLTFDDGVAPKNYTLAPNPILVINWQPPSDPENPQLKESKFKDSQDVWQISGLTGYFTQSEVEAILKQVYKLYSSDEKLIAPDLIVAGNNWGSGRQIDPVIEELSKKYKFRAYHLSSPFTKANLNTEPDSRIQLFKEALSKIQQGEMDPDESATTTKQTPEDIEKSAPEGH